MCAIQDLLPEQIFFEKQSAAATLAWLDNPTGVHPSQFLAGFPALIKKYRKRYPDCSITLQQHKDLKKLHSEFRNQFTHFAPMQWSIEVAGLPRIAKTALDLIEDAMRKHQVEIHLTCDMKKRLAENLKIIREALDCCEIAARLPLCSELRLCLFVGGGIKSKDPAALLHIFTPPSPREERGEGEDRAAQATKRPFHPSPPFPPPTTRTHTRSRPRRAG